MAGKNKVINTVLRLKDDMSGGLLQAAKNAKKAGAGITDEMMKSTRQVIAWKNKFKSSLAEAGKKAAAFSAATVTALAGGFLALDGATEEYRRAQGRLNTAFDAAKLKAEDAAAAYDGFYRILGDADTATEASQLLAELTQNSEDISTWLHIAAGAAGKWGDSLPIEGLIESMNETAKTGQVTGVFADALNWAAKSGETFGVTMRKNTKANEEWNKSVENAESAEDYFNLALKGCASEADRNNLIMNTMLGLYNDAAHAFYENNGELMKSRDYHAQLAGVMGRLGTASATVKNGLLEMLGAQEDGGFRAGSALDLATQKAEQFADWVGSVDFSQFSDQVDEKISTSLDTAKTALDWCREHSDQLVTGLKVLAVAFGTVKVLKFSADLISAASTIKDFLGTVNAMIAAKYAESAATAHSTAVMALNRTGTIASAAANGSAAGATGILTAAQQGLNAAMAANPLGVIIIGVIALTAVMVTLYKKSETFRNFVNGTFRAALKGITSVFDGVTKAVGGLINKVKDFLGMDTNKTVKVKTEYASGSVEHNALGTSYWKGGLTRVNERGGEIMNLPGGTQIIPHDLSRKAAGGGRTVNVYVTVQGNVIGNKQFAHEVGEEVADEILRKIDNVA